jgi:asparagine synthase (glutamine-hydrolysing)
MSVINHFCSVYQMFTDPRVYSYMWSLHPSLRADEVYAVLLGRLHPNLARLPWARTNRALRGRTEGTRAGLRREFHDYPGWISGPLYEEFARRVDPDWCAGTGLFDADRVRALSRLAREDPDGAARPYAVSPFKIFAWLACFRHFVEWAEAQGKRLRLNPGAVRPVTHELRVPFDPTSKLRRLLQNIPAVYGAVRAARLGLLRYEARLRYRPRS